MFLQGQHWQCKKLLTSQYTEIFYSQDSQWHKLSAQQANLQRCQLVSAVACLEVHRLAKQQHPCLGQIQRLWHHMLIDPQESLCTQTNENWESGRID